jgi:outer membrane protein insertion porin family
LSRRRFALFVVIAAVAATANPAGADDRVRVALLPLVVHSGVGREYLQKGMNDMLVSRLGRDRSIAVIPVDDAAKATTDAEAARKTGQANDASYVVFGSLTRFGEGASVDLSVATVSAAGGEPRTVYVHANTMGALIPLLDGAAERVAGVVHGGTGAVAAGPGGAAPPGELQELRRRVEMLERSVFRGNAGSEKPDADAAEPAGKEPGLPTDRDAERVR